MDSSIILSKNEHSTHFFLTSHVPFSLSCVIHIFVFLPLGSVQSGLHREQKSCSQRTDTRDWMTLERPRLSICLDSLETGVHDTKSLQ